MKIQPQVFFTRDGLSPYASWSLWEMHVIAKSFSLQRVNESKFAHFIDNLAVDYEQVSFTVCTQCQRDKTCDPTSERHTKLD